MGQGGGGRRPGNGPSKRQGFASKDVQGRVSQKEMVNAALQGLHPGGGGGGGGGAAARRRASAHHRHFEQPFQSERHSASAHLCSLVLTGLRSVVPMQHPKQCTSSQFNRPANEALTCTLWC